MKQHFYMAQWTSVYRRKAAIKRAVVAGDMDRARQLATSAHEAIDKFSTRQTTDTGRKILHENIDATLV